jgi:hypothetical protein
MPPASTPHDRTLAPLVARRVHGDAVLADRACPVHATGRLPVALIERFTGDGAEPLIALLRFLGPITGGAAMQAR